MVSPQKTEKGNRFSFIQGPGGLEITMKSCFDTDKAFHMSFDEVTFNADRIRSKLELLSEELMPCKMASESIAVWHSNRS